MTRKSQNDVFDRHQYKIARDTLRMSDAGAAIMGGMSKAEAREYMKRARDWTDEMLAEYEAGE